MSTPAEFIAAARSAGLRAEPVQRLPADSPEGVNAWDKDGDYPLPDTTVWWPRPHYPNDQIVWGPDFEYSAAPFIDAETLVMWVRGLPT